MMTNVIGIERHADANPPEKSSLEQLREWVDGMELGQIFLTALELDVFSKLQRPLSADELAADLGTHLELTDKLLNVLVGMQLLTRSDGQYRTASPVAPYLVRQSPSFARYLNHCLRIRASMAGLTDFLHDGPHVLPDTDTDIVDANDPDWGARVDMLGHPQPILQHLTVLPEFKKAHRLIELGGGQGRFAVSFALENPNLQVVVFDKAHAIGRIQSYVNRYGLQNRVRTMTGNFLYDNLGENYDIVFEACAFEGDDVNFRLFSRKVASALKTGGLFICLTFALDDDRNGPLLPLLWDLKNHLTGSGHRMMRTNAALVQLLAWAGLETEEIIDLSPWCKTPLRLFLARKSPIPQ